MKILVLLAMAAALWAAAPAQQDEPKRDPAKRFAKADSNGDGKLSLEEFQGKNPQNAEKRAKQFKRMDTDGDGFVTLEEYTAARERAAAKKAKKKQQ